MNRGEETAQFEATKILMKILHQGGIFSKVLEAISLMLNGLKYYSLELRLNDDRYYIQAYEREATELYNLAVEINDKINVIRN